MVGVALLIGLVCCRRWRKMRKNSRNYSPNDLEVVSKYYERKKISELKQAELEKDLMDSEFGDWLSSLKEEEINDFVPSAFRKMDVNGQPKQAALKEHFRKNIWPQVKNKLQVL